LTNPALQRQDGDPAAALARATPDRLLNAAQAMRHGFPLEEIQKITHYDPWFLGEIRTIIETEAEIRADGLPTDARTFRRLKGMGFSDARRKIDRDEGKRCARSAAGACGASLFQAHRFLRRGIRRPHALHVLDL